MTAKQTQKFLRSDEFDAACLLEYPYGFDEDTAAGQEKISIVHARYLDVKNQWTAIYAAGVPEDWDTPAKLPEFHRVCSADNNAGDTSREKGFPVNCVEFYRVALSSYDGYEV